MDIECKLFKLRKEVLIAEEYIRNNWEDKWRKDIIYVNGKTNYEIDEEDYGFFPWLNETMRFVTEKQNWHRKMNFFLKMLGVLSFPILYTVILCYTGNKDLDFTQKYINMLIMLVPTYIISKWIDMRKHQETWSRYTAYRSALLQEMTKYLYDISPYDNSETRKKRFIEEVLILTKKNGVAFQYNMEEKEKQIVDPMEIKKLFRKK